MSKNSQLSISRIGLAAVLLVLLASLAGAQSPSAADKGRIVLVLPFENRTGQPGLEWMREAASELISDRLAAAGFAPLSRADRLYAFNHLGFPEGFQPSRAAAIRIAQTLDADSIVVGSFVTDGANLVVEARLVNVAHLSMSSSMSVRGEMRQLMDSYGRLAWQLARQLDPAFSGNEEAFVTAGSAVKLEAFEQFTRGATEADHEERLRHLQQAVALSPDYSQAWMALGREQFSSQRYEEAINAFARVQASGPQGLEAGFYRGLALMFTGNYPQAEQAFAEVAHALPLAEVLSNEGVAQARRGLDATALFRQAIAADPVAADYHFNLAIALKRQGRSAEALTELEQCLRLRPGDGEVQAMRSAWSVRGAGPTDSNVGGADQTHPDPLERIERRFDEAAFRQAAAMIEQLRAAQHR